MGDFNIDFLKTSVSRNRMVNLMESFNLNQVIKSPTHVNLNLNTSSLIDVIITNKGNKVLNADSVFYLTT